MIALLSFGFVALIGFCAGNWFCLRMHIRTNIIESVVTREEYRPSGIERYWMEQGEGA